MPGAGPPARRGRKEALIDPAAPEHRRVFAQRLRDLRIECQAPPYRVLSVLSHCASGTLSEAAGGRRLPTWETTRAYVIGCLRHAGREDELARVLPRWRIDWEHADLAERGRHAERPTVAAAPPTRRRWRRGRLLLAAVILLVTATSLPAGEAAGPAAMTGLYNIVLAPRGWHGGDRYALLAERLDGSIDRDLRAWAGAMSSVQIRRAPSETVADDAADAALRRIAAEHGADVVLRPVFRLTADRLSTTVEIFIADRTLAETPEFAGRHDISVSEPVDVVDQNLSLNESLTAATRRYLSAVVLFVRGLGSYALADFPAAEQQFRRAGHEFDTVAGSVGDQHIRRAVLHLMIGNAVGRQDPAGAAGYFRRALAEDRGYRRAEIGLAEALRAPDPCAPGKSDARRLHEAIGHYRRSLRLGRAGRQAPNPLLDVKAHLGLGLTAQCLSLAGIEPGWERADAEFAEVLRLQRGADLTAAADRHARWLAAEARAGQALDALAGTGSYAEAAAGFERALAMMNRIDALRSTYLERKLVFLQNLRFAYQHLDDADATMRTDRRIADTERRLSALPAIGGR
ncbi:hypothetical protein [Mangrovihabitans endophyticus]|uniref:Tetratricopeptide repeat-containing protein n=1 Tax=Mangrovihabitans endophyticus TaxID=1751298 RepID=A0A8J3BVZ6_9ACTN|nr:hypothetical protein [Mangrovihabitans endophyticus]GGK73646.1 hypothetical protein GCM10012284_04420 [Mangrovihabitans endophyticus]